MKSLVFERNVQAHKRLYEQVETLAYTHNRILISVTFQLEVGMHPKKTKFADHLEKLFNEFLAHFKISNPINIYLKYFLQYFTQTLTKPSLISKWN